MNYRIIYDDELYHHGIKGMKWGVRKQPEIIGRQRRTVDDRYRAEVRQRRIRAAVGIGISVATVALTAYGGYQTLKFVNSPAFRRGAAQVAKMLARGNAYKTASYAQKINVGADTLAKASLVGSVGRAVYYEGAPYAKSAYAFAKKKYQNRRGSKS